MRPSDSTTVTSGHEARHSGRSVPLIFVLAASSRLAVSYSSVLVMPQVTEVAVPGRVKVKESVRVLDCSSAAAGGPVTTVATAAASELADEPSRSPRARHAGVVTPDVPPAGLVYVPDFLAEDEEQELLEVLAGLDYSAVVLHGQAARRVVRHYGWDYGYETRSLAPADPLPPALEPVRARAAGLVGRRPEELAEVLVTRYPPGAGIGWHRDAPMFGPEVVGVSLGAAARMRFQRRRAGERETWELALAPRSAYVLAGAARSAWQHTVPPVRSERSSITFRTVRHPERWGGGVVSDRIP